MSFSADEVLKMSDEIMSKNSFIEARETAIKRAQEAPERQKEIVGKYLDSIEEVIEAEEKYGKEAVEKALLNPTIYNLDGTRKENAPNYLPEGYEMVNGQAEYVGSTTSTGENESGGDGMEGFEGYIARVLGREDLAKEAEEKARREREENELVGEVKQSDYIDESSISFSRWELMGFIIALIVGIIVSALIVVAVKNNKRGRNKTTKNGAECDVASETTKEDATNVDEDSDFETVTVVATEVDVKTVFGIGLAVDAESAPEMSVAVDAEADTEGNDATVDEINKEESTVTTVKTDEKSDTTSEHTEKFSTIKKWMQSVAIRNILGVVTGIAAFIVALFAVGLIYALLLYIPSFASGLASYAGFSIVSNVIAPFAGCFAAKKVCERVSLYNSAWNKPGCIVLRVLFFIFAGLSFVSACLNVNNIFLFIQSVVFLAFGVAGNGE